MLLSYCSHNSIIFNVMVQYCNVPLGGEGIALCCFHQVCTSDFGSESFSPHFAKHSSDMQKKNLYHKRMSCFDTCM